MCLATGCAGPVLLDDEIYSHGADHRVLCAGNIDDKNDIEPAQIVTALDRVADDGTVLHVYAHRPGETAGDTIRLATLERLFEGAAARGIPFVTYEALAAGAEGPAIALSFDDHNLAQWTAIRPLFDQYGARVTLFISKYHFFDDVGRAQLQDLAADGHDIEYHSTNHVPAADYVAEHGLAQYLDDEIGADLALMRADGYDPHVFSYPFGSRTAEIDRALEAQFTLIRASNFACPN